MSLLTQYRASQDTDLRQRLAMAFATAAVNVSSEAADTPNHANRAAWALSVLGDPYAAAVRYAPAVMTGWQVSDEADDPDQELQDAVNSLVNALAGVS